MGRRQLTQAQKDANKEAREKAARAKSAKAGAAAHQALLAMQPRQASEGAAAADAGAAANAGAAGAAGAGGAHGTDDADADAHPTPAPQCRLSYHPRRRPGFVYFCILGSITRNVMFPRPVSGGAPACSW